MKKYIKPRMETVDPELTRDITTTPTPSNSVGINSGVGGGGLSKSACGLEYDDDNEWDTWN